ncbi:MAG: hypothetical protein R3253_16240, partial [Longimicrobiales bacterium]|nr:hypothetical protein [Longimicrobiales bacterium]
MTGLLISFLLASVQVAGGPDDHRLYGRVTLEDGRVVTGYFRWDGNEASRQDFLDASREIPRAILEEAERLDPDFAAEMRRRRSIVAFGMRIRWDEDDLEGPPSVPMAVRFAHLRSLAPLDGGGARLELTDGYTVDVRGTTTDVGPGMRDLVVDTGDGRVEVDWHDMLRVDFMKPPPGSPMAADSTLYGTVRTWGELDRTGFVAWDRDEVFLSDVLDGRNDSGERQIAFRDIGAIAPEGRRSAQVTLRTGEVLSLRGTNDVDRGNRGIEVSGMGWGRVIVPWGDLESVRFGPRGAEEDVEVDIGPIRGTVYARDGRVLEGTLRWGHEEERRWELLDGWHGDTSVQIEFGAIEQIRPDEDDGSVIVL